MKRYIKASNMFPSVGPAQSASYEDDSYGFSLNTPTEFNSTAVLSILDQYDIDTTMNEYELIFEKYNRIEPNKRYRIIFKCPGDYLAYFSMPLHRSPTTHNIYLWCGPDKFLDIVSNHPSVRSISEYADYSWHGGESPIISLVNVSRGRILYDIKEGYVDIKEQYEWS